MKSMSIEEERRKTFSKVFEKKSYFTALQTLATGRCKKKKQQQVAGAEALARRKYST
jgi:hypothetical protein